MKPYPKNNIKYKPITPIYIKNTTQYKESRYSTYRVIDNLPYNALEVKLTNSISQNETYNGFYYTTSKNETLYEISKKYYGSEKFYWIIAKANGLKNNGISILPQDVTLIVPSYTELQIDGGYFTKMGGLEKL